MRISKWNLQRFGIVPLWITLIKFTRSGDSLPCLFYLFPIVYFLLRKQRYDRQDLFNVATLICYFRIQIPTSVVLIGSAISLGQRANLKGVTSISNPHLAYEDIVVSVGLLVVSHWHSMFRPILSWLFVSA